MKPIARIALPSHGPGGEFDHAAVDSGGDRLYVAHPSNNAVEGVDLARRAHVGSLTGLRGVAGVWVDTACRLLFTSNRGEDTASVFRLDEQQATELFRAPTGSRPNGMAFDPGRKVLMVAGVGKDQAPNARPTLTFVDAGSGAHLGHIEVPGRTRWTLYHRATDSFYANIADPPMVLAVRAGDLPAVSRTFPIPARGPHGLEQHPDGNTLYCACDEGVLLALDLARGTSRIVGHLAGPPDVLWLSRTRCRLYCAVGEPGVVETFDLEAPGPS